jgi:type I restriction enzyme S subunit
MDIASVKRVHQEDWVNCGIRFLRARDIVAAEKNEPITEPLYISQKQYDEFSVLCGKVKAGDMLVTGVGTIGVPMLVICDDPLYFKDGNIIWFKNRNALAPNYFYHAFTGKRIQSYINESAGIGTVGTYTIDSGKKTPIDVPCEAEQRQIGSLFQQLDNLITLHQRKSVF